MVGIETFYRVQKETKLSMADLVYGEEHTKEFHFDTYYKPRYLRTKVNGKMYAFPNGLPGGWSI